MEPTKWGHTTIKKILATQEYCGDVINFKSYSKSYKMKKRIENRSENRSENRAIFRGVHEAIIDRPTWEKVQVLKAATRRKKPTVTQEPSAFSGVFEVPDRRKIPERDILLETRRGVALGYAPAGIAV